MTPEEFRRAMEIAAATGRDLDAVLVEEFGVDRSLLLKAKAYLHGLHAVDLTLTAPQPDAVRLIPAELARRIRAVPVVRKDPGLVVAVTEAPVPPALLEALRSACGLEIVPVLADAVQLQAALDRAYPAAD